MVGTIVLPRSPIDEWLHSWRILRAVKLLPSHFLEGVTFLHEPTIAHLNMKPGHIALFGGYPSPHGAVNYRLWTFDLPKKLRDGDQKVLSRDSILGRIGGWDRIRTNNDVQQSSLIGRRMVEYFSRIIATDETFEIGCAVAE